MERTASGIGAETLDGLYPRLLGPAWFDLDPVIRRMHLPGRVVISAFEIRLARGVVARAVRSALRLPTSGDARDTRLVITRDARMERWARKFGRCSLVTIQRVLADGSLAERIGPLELRFRLYVAGGALTYVQAGAALTVGRWGLTLPRWLAPRIEAREERENGGDRVRVHVRISAPVIGFLMSYVGCLHAETAE
jgi:hypothetical protein